MWSNQGSQHTAWRLSEKIRCRLVRNRSADFPIHRTRSFVRLVATHYSDPQVHLERFVDLPDVGVDPTRGHAFQCLRTKIGSEGHDHVRDGRSY